MASIPCDFPVAVRIRRNHAKRVYPSCDTKLVVITEDFMFEAGIGEYYFTVSANSLRQLLPKMTTFVTCRPARAIGPHASRRQFDRGNPGLLSTRENSP